MGTKHIDDLAVVKTASGSAVPSTQERTVRRPLTTPKTVSTNNTTMKADGATSFGTSAETPSPAPIVMRATRLVVVRSERMNVPPYRICEGRNYIGRSADTAVDIDLTGHEPPDQVWSSRQHAVVTIENGVVTIEDLNSLNGTFVNRSRLHPGQRRVLNPNDVIQIGTVQFRIEG